MHCLIWFLVFNIYWYKSVYVQHLFCVQFQYKLNAKTSGDHYIRRHHSTNSHRNKVTGFLIFWFSILSIYTHHSHWWWQLKWKETENRSSTSISVTNPKINAKKKCITTRQGRFLFYSILLRENIQWTRTVKQRFVHFIDFMAENFLYKYDNVNKAHTQT